MRMHLGLVLPTGAIDYTVCGQPVSSPEDDGDGGTRTTSGEPVGVGGDWAIAQLHDKACQDCHASADGVLRGVREGLRERTKAEGSWSLHAEVVDLGEHQEAEGRWGVRFAVRGWQVHREEHLVRYPKRAGAVHHACGILEHHAKTERKAAHQGGWR